MEKVTIEVSEISSDRVQRPDTQHENTMYRKERKVKKSAKNTKRKGESTGTQQEEMEQVLTADQMSDRLMELFAQK